jgi:hypothetical protein
MERPRKEYVGREGSRTFFEYWDGSVDMEWFLKSRDGVARMTYRCSDFIWKCRCRCGGLE